MLDTQLLKGTLPLLVLSLLSRGDLYGYQLIKEMERLSGGVFQFGEGSLYPVLHSLERDRLLQPDWREADSGRKRKYYRLTPAGREELRRRQAEWRTLADAVAAITGAEENSHG